MQGDLQLRWDKTPSGKVLGTFIDGTGQQCSISLASFHKDPAISIVSSHGSLVLTQEMCVEMCQVLAYFGYGGHLPKV